MAVSPDKSEVANGSVRYSHKNVNGTVYTPPTVIATTVVRSDQRAISSVNTPNWGAKKGWKHWNPYGKQLSLLYDPPGSWKYVFTGSHGTSILLYEGANAAYLGCPYAPAPEDLPDDPTQKVIAKIQDKIKLDKTNSLVTLAEAHKTADHLAKTATRIYGALKALKRGEIGEFTRNLGITASRQQKTRWRTSRDVTRPGGDPKGIGRVRVSYESKTTVPLWDWMANTWLEYSYAWKPLLYDLFGTVEALAETMTERLVDVRAVSARSHSHKSTTRFYQTSDVLGEVKCEADHYVEMKIWYRIERGEASNPVNAFGMSNPLSVAWELVPFSFVADWFLPIGRALEGLTAYNGLVFEGGSKTVRTNYSFSSSCKGTRIPYPYSGGTLTPEGEAALNRDAFSMVRSGLSAFPSYGFPKFKDPRSFAHAASAVSLLHSIFLSKNGSLSSIRK